MYREADTPLSVSFISPSVNEYSVSPAKRIISGEAEVALCPSESVLAYRDKGPDRLVAVATVLATDASAIAVLENSDIQSPKQLEGKTYASYAARYEDSLVKQMILNAGGQTGDFVADKVKRLDIWKNLVNRQVDATWVFMPWEGLLGERQGVKLRSFKLGDYGLEYGYSPVIAVRAGWLEDPANEAALRSFLAASRKGYETALAGVEAAANHLINGAPGEKDLADRDFVRASQAAVSRHYTAHGLPWGTMDAGVWADFVQTLSRVDGSVQPAAVTLGALFTNAYLPA